MSTHVQSGKHPRRNMWGEVRLPSNAYRAFKELRHGGFFHPSYTWAQCCAAFRKKRHKMKIAKENRRRNRSK